MTEETEDSSWDGIETTITEDDYMTNGLERT